MGEKHIARFEPVGIELEVDEDETILDAAFRQGIMLMHGCKEGQCSACKSFLLDGEVDLDRYSTFALPDFEEAEGYTLLCRAHALSDVEIELLNFDEEILRSGVPIVEAVAEVEAVEELTHDIRRLVLKLPDPLVFNAGQYMDISIPGADGEHRSFSMANTPGEPDRLEFMIKLYEGGHFSGLLAGADDGACIKVGDQLSCKGPYGVFTLRDSSPRRLVFIAGGAGMAPIMSLLRSMEEKGLQRPATFYYGARTAQDLFVLEELERLAGVLPDMKFVPALSDEADGWEGEAGLITDVVDRMEEDLTEVDAYLCGPPPMVDAAIALLERRGVPESRIYYDKFTTTAAE
ncbi:MAG TPA: 2Fe-2S iron-sulfur cluster binding domain-containing protein [Baekduia sp.]